MIANLLSARSTLNETCCVNHVFILDWMELDNTYNRFFDHREFFHLLVDKKIIVDLYTVDS